ncbi:TTC4 [Bugula neritina]|uniref:TTC4 n=1 Tax=Bugula neritina TaxID=10212 RepID=A0A7J7J3T4_BUGNE|nr:TTC4 [Bugula neritina]
MAPKRKMTDEERAVMVAQMDRDLEDFISEKIESYKATPRDPFDFSKMEKEIENHPAFMQEWDPTKPMTPELEALISLKYEECDTLVEKATNYKEDGNRNFKNSKYRWAIDNYTVAIECKCSDLQLNAICYTNRAAAQFRLGNYRSSFRDVVFARKFVPDHMKAIIRGVHCAKKIRKYDIALRWIDDGLLIDSTNEELLKLRHESEKLKLRNIKLKSVEGDDHDDEEMVGEEWESLFGRTSNKEAASARVFLDDFGTLHWPILLLYPEYGQTDFITQANETTRLVDLLYQVLGPETPEADWDLEKLYKLENLEIYFENKLEETLYQVDINASIQAVISHPKYIVYGGLPSLIILVKGSEFAKDFLKKYSISTN